METNHATTDYRQEARREKALALQAKIEEKQVFPKNALAIIALHFIHLPHQLYRLSLVSKFFHSIFTQDDIWDNVVQYWFPNVNSQNRSISRPLRGLAMWRRHWRDLWSNTCIIMPHHSIKAVFDDSIRHALAERRNLVFMWYDGKKKLEHINRGDDEDPSRKSSHNTHIQLLCEKKHDVSNLGFCNENTAIAAERWELIQHFMNVLFAEIENDRKRYAKQVSLSYYEVPMQYTPSNGCDTKKNHRVVRDVLQNPTKYRKPHGYTSGVEILELFSNKKNIKRSKRGREGDFRMEPYNDNRIDDRNDKRNDRYDNGQENSQDANSEVEYPNESKQPLKDYARTLSSQSNPYSNSYPSMHTNSYPTSQDDGYDDPYKGMVTYNMKRVTVNPPNGGPSANRALFSVTKYKVGSFLVAHKVIDTGDRIVQVLHDDEPFCSCPMAQVLEFNITQFHSASGGMKHRLEHFVRFVIVPPQCAQWREKVEKGEGGEALEKKLDSKMDSRSDTIDMNENRQASSRNDCVECLRNFTLERFTNELVSFKVKELRQTSRSVNDSDASDKSEKSEKGESKKRKKHETLLGSICEVKNVWTQFVGIVNVNNTDTHSDKMLNLKTYALQEMNRRR